MLAIISYGRSFSHSFTSPYAYFTQGTGSADNTTHFLVAHGLALGYAYCHMAKIYPARRAVTGIIYYIC